MLFPFLLHFLWTRRCSLLQPFHRILWLPVCFQVPAASWCAWCASLYAGVASLPRDAIGCIGRIGGCAACRSLFRPSSLSLIYCGRRHCAFVVAFFTVHFDRLCFSSVCVLCLCFLLTVVSLRCVQGYYLCLCPLLLRLLLVLTNLDSFLCVVRFMLSWQLYARFLPATVAFHFKDFYNAKFTAHKKCMQSCQDLYDYACQVFEDLQPAPSGTKQLTSHCHTR